MTTIKSYSDLQQSKQEWSKEDINKIDTIIGYIVSSAGEKLGDLLPCINWLKSLRPQSTWKPSDEQMNAIDYVKNFDYGGYKDMLVSLYYDLKKLKDE